MKTHVRRVRGQTPDFGKNDTPPVMWPEPGSGFEANQYSPAGGAQRGWRVVRAANDASGARSLLGRGLLIIGILPVLAVLAWGVVQIVRDVLS